MNYLSTPLQKSSVKKSRSVCANKNTVTLFFLLSFLGTSLYSQITVQIKNCKDSVLYLARYEHNYTLMVDTGKVDRKTFTTVFKAKKPFEQGMYIVVSQAKSIYFEMIIYKEKKFKIQTDTTKGITGMVITGSEENKAFSEYVKVMSEKNKEMQNIQSELRKNKDKDSTKKMQEEGIKLTKQVRAFQKEFIAKHPKSYWTKMLYLQLEPETDNLTIPKASNGRPDSLYTYFYYKNHFWDGIDLSDSSTINNQFFYPRLKKYFSNVVVQHPDSITQNAFELVEKTKGNKHMFKYIVHYVTHTYETSPVMGFDEVFVNIGKKYYRTKQAYWLDSAQYEKILERIDILEPLVLGNIAPELQLIDTTGLIFCTKIGLDTAKTSEDLSRKYFANYQELSKIFVPLRQVKAKYTLALFWEPGCGHCQKEVPKIKHTRDSLRTAGIDFEVYAVCTQHNYEEWKKFIIKNNLNWINVADVCHSNDLRKKYDIYSTPVLYLLDENKKIIAKRIANEQIADIIQHEEKKNTKTK